MRLLGNVREPLKNLLHLHNKGLLRVEASQLQRSPSKRAIWTGTGTSTTISFMMCGTGIYLIPKARHGHLGNLLEERDTKASRKKTRWCIHASFPNTCLRGVRHFGAYVFRRVLCV